MQLQLEPQGIGNRLRDVVLHGKNIVELPVVCFRPEVIACGDVDELCGYAYLVAHLAHRPLENGRNVERIADLADIVIVAAELERRRACRDLESVNLCQDIE